MDKMKLYKFFETTLKLKIKNDAGNVYLTVFLNKIVCNT